MITRQNIIDLLEEIVDPEIPVLTIRDLGLLRGVDMENGQWIITITPTYSGCPAMNMIEMQIRAILEDSRIGKFDVRTVLSPPWTTDWMTETGKKKLRTYGIAPPIGQVARVAAMMEEDIVIQCPHCRSDQTKLVSQFGSTACKSLYKCEECLEPFDYFKCH